MSTAYDNILQAGEWRAQSALVETDDVIENECRRRTFWIAYSKPVQFIVNVYPLTTTGPNHFGSS